MGVTKKKAEINKHCVACGCCVKKCPLTAISIYKGMYAVIDDRKCVGCGKCADNCPASVIAIVPRGDLKNETKTLA